MVNDGTVNLANNQVLDLDGKITNTGLVNLQSGGNATDLVVQSSTVTLDGGGTISLSDNGSNRIYGASGSNVLDNVDNLIVGAGEIGRGSSRSSITPRSTRAAATSSASIPATSSSMTG